MADQTQRLEIATVRAEVGSNIVYRFANDAAAATPIPTESGDIPNLKQIILDIQLDATEKISISTTIYPTASAGLAATSDQEIFLVQSDDANEIYTVWKNNAGSAVNTGKSAMSSEAIQQALQASNEAAQAAEDAADVATNRTAGFLSPSLVDPVVRDNGLPLEQGDRYFNTADQLEKIYTASGWAANDSIEAIESIRNSSDPEKGGREVGYDGANVSDMLDLARPLADYPALRSYSGSAKIVRITKAGIEGFFAKLASGSYVDDNGITIVSATGEAWRRLFVGDIYVVWFEPPTGGVDALAAFNRAAAAAVAAQNGSSSASTPRVVVSEGTYTLSGPTAGSVKWLLLPTGKLTTPSVIPGLDFSCERLSGKVDRRTGSKQFTSMIVGDGAMSANKVLTEIGAPNLFPAEIMGCSSNAAGGIMGSSRTGSRDGFDMASIGVIGLSVNDNLTTLKPGYGFYSEGVRLSGAGNENAAELTIVNYGSVVADTPNRTRGATDGETYNLCLSSGGALGSGAQDATGAILITQKAAGAYEKGIVFKNGSVKSNTAIAMWENQRITLFGTGNQGVEREGVRYSGFVAANEQGVASIGTWDNPSASWRGITIQSSALSPTNDNVMSVGTPSLRTSVIYSATGSIQTSDERSKVEISDIPDCVLDAWALVKYKTYKLSDSVTSKGGDARWHFGITAQSVKEAFESLGLNPFDYGVLCYDSWDDQWEEIPEVTRSVPAIYSEILDSKGQKILVSDARLEIIEPARRELKVAAGDRYGVRYDEAAILSLALLQRAVERSAS
ncbi:hypothetical protein A3K88_02635 [Pseudomonas putida]|nr:hypothetical protein A3K88_02635 [Pseudomonas putida]